MILESILNRRSIRKFKPGTIEKNQIEAILEAGMLAPSACNTRAWRFYAITDRDMLNKLADAHNWAKMLYSAACCIVVIALPALQDDVQDGIARGYFPQDCAAVTENILLQAEHMGFGACWCGVYPKPPIMETISGILGVAEGEVPFCLIAIGHKDEHPSPRGKYQPEKVTWI